ncbi:MAG: alpha-ketoacid dehydrogenase subunit beta [Alphaproteobacteria bacterium]|jgi:acetoin:2,6-dichlorophenolindophenol oxidoreductase subunit beta|nr:alpha-ketoacid dehydrogenase subunit beta [Alphaproteobacteria bacterium]MBT4018777.1 alpha-ketoacid dehydrogenase subunit beta [Alphaproteobacteria bacterium]MBT4966366.1 alpha-ketoacid dehydrogenase subunit beta [Alphaproteobacteria bacterium]MBT5160184.1 alpha-ketoacid dehydrogenase subunit beta [Alphaproteobacteria bacterium]MBT6385471.1 alpha-ketoacid dehydrogenase subunit beta [Alphaproteobacteria bacterium]
MTIMTYANAALEAIRQSMQSDPTVWCVGEDLGRGGVFGQYKGLREEFGEARISDAPISEAAIMGAAFGAAMVGTRPVVEMRFADFALCATDELVNQIAKARFMFGGQSRAPMVIRKPMGLWRSSAAQHSQSLESWYVHIPGLVVLCPATPQDNYSMLKAAIACDDPVVYLEHKNIWALEGDVDFDHQITLGEASTRRTGADVTIVSWSNTANLAVEAADTLADKNIDAEVIDLRSLWPWDKSAVLDSVRKTGRLVVAHESVAVGGFGAEIVATVAEQVASSLKGPVRRLGAPRSLIAYAPNLEDKMRVTAEMIVTAAQETFE